MKFNYACDNYIVLYINLYSKVALKFMKLDMEQV